MGTEPLVFSFTDKNLLVAPPTCGLLVVPDLLAQVRSWCRTDADVLVVDLSAVEELDMTMFRTLLWARRYCTGRGRDLAVVPPAAGVIAPEDEPLVRALLPIRSEPSTVVPEQPQPPTPSVVPA